MPGLDSLQAGFPLGRTLSDALHSLRIFGRRSLLALTGIMVGSAAIIALLNIGHSAAVESAKVFKNLGINTMIATFQDMPGIQAQSTVPDGLEDIQSPLLTHVAALSVQSMEIRQDGKATDATVVGTTSELAPSIHLRMARGRFLSKYDRAATFAVIGAKIFDALESAGAHVEIGSQLQIGGYLFDIVGIAAPESSNPLLPTPVDWSVMVPIAMVGRIFRAPRVNVVIATVPSPADLANGAEALRAAAASRLPGQEISIQIPRQLIEGMRRQADNFSYLLGGIGGISLLVGGIGVMNVMLMSVMDRRREIGVRVALGARAQDIRMLFLLEAIVLSFAGSLLGTGLGFAASYIFTHASGWRFSLEPAAMPLGVCSSLLVGIFSGLYPAMLAARMRPAEALRDA